MVLACIQSLQLQLIRNPRNVCFLRGRVRKHADWRISILNLAQALVSFCNRFWKEQAKFLWVHCLLPLFVLNLRLNEKPDCMRLNFE